MSLNFFALQLYCFGSPSLLPLASFSIAAGSFFQKDAGSSAHYILNRTPVSNKLVKESQAAAKEDIYFVGICRWHPTVPLFSPIAVYKERCSTLHFLSIQIPPWPSLASCCGPHLIQDDVSGLQGRQQNWTRLPPDTGQTTRYSTNTSLGYISWPTGSAIAESKQNSHSEVTNFLCSGASVVEQTPDQRPRVPLLPSTRTAKKYEVYSLKVRT